MEDLLALNNIRTVQFLDGSDVERKYAFTSKMATENIFIEYYSIEPSEADEDEEEQGIEDDAEVPEYGSLLSVIIKHENKYYDFVMFHNTIEIGVPIMLLQTIIFLAKLIDDTAPGQLVKYLASIATDPLIPHTIRDKEFKDSATELIKLKLETIQNLIQANNAYRN